MFTDQTRATLLKATKHSCEEKITIQFLMKLTLPLTENIPSFFCCCTIFYQIYCFQHFETSRLHDIFFLSFHVAVPLVSKFFRGNAKSNDLQKLYRDFQGLPACDRLCVRVPAATVLSHFNR